MNTKRQHTMKILLTCCLLLLAACIGNEQPTDPVPTSASEAIVSTLPPSPTPAPTDTPSPTEPAAAEGAETSAGQAAVEPTLPSSGAISMLMFPTKTPPAVDPSSFDPPMPNVEDIQFTATPDTDFPTRTPIPTRTPEPSGGSGAGGSNTPVPATATPAIDTGWTGDYFSNASLSGSPAYSRSDSQINFNWGSGSPTDLPNDNFSIRWSRFFTFQAGVYRFSAFSDDGVRVYVNGDLIINAWGSATGQTIQQDVILDADTYNISVEYYEGSGDAQIQVSWEALTDNVWLGDYYSNSTLSGSPFLSQLDTNINFDWDGGSPITIDDNEDGINDFPSDNFSIRWFRLITVDAGTYRFTAQADDGVRVFVDSNLIINEWHDGRGDVTYEGITQLTGGNHLLIVEYFENSGGASINVDFSRQ